MHHLVRVAFQLLGAVLGELGDRRLRGVPVARPVLIEVGGRCGQPPQGIAEHGRRLARHHAPELDAAVLQATVRGGRRGSRAEVNRARHTPTGRELAEVRDLAVESQGQRAGAVHVLFEDRHPVVREVARQFGLHARVVDGDVGRLDQRIPVALLPQAVDHGGHQAQHATRALELHQRGPVGVEAVKHFRVDRVGRAQALLIVRIAALRRELLMLGAVEIGKGPCHHVAVGELRRIGQGLEEPAAHDLKPLFGARWPPGGLDTPDHVAQPVERFAPALAAHLDIVRMRVGGSAVSEAGRLMTSRQCCAAFAASVRAWAKVNCVSNVPAGRSLWSWSWRA